MAKLFGLSHLFLFVCGFASTLTGGSAEETQTKHDQSNQYVPEESIKVMPSEDRGEQTKTPEDSPIFLLTPQSNLKYEVRQFDWPFYPFYNPYQYFNPYLNKVNSVFFKNLIDQYTNDLEMIKQRQNILIKYAESSCPNSEKCQKVNRPDVTEDIRSIKNWNWGPNMPDVEYVSYDRFYAVTNGFKSSIEKLTLRQNMIYEFVECSCTARAECGTSIKPVLDVMFANNRNQTGQLIQSLFTPGNYNPASSFFQTLASYLSQIPTWFAFNFSPIATPFASGYQTFYNPPTTSSVPSTSYSSSSLTSTSNTNSVPASSTYYSTTSPQIAQTSPTSSYSGVSSAGGQPVYSSSSSVSSSSGPGHHVSEVYISTGGGGKPTQEQYVVSSNGENIQVSSSTGGSSSVSSTKPPGARRRRFSEVYPVFRLDPIQAGAVAAQGVHAGLSAVQQGVQAGFILVQQGVHAGIASVQHGVQAAAINVQQGLAAGLQG